MGVFIMVGIYNKLYCLIEKYGGCMISVVYIYIYIYISPFLIRKDDSHVHVCICGCANRRILFSIK